jgi:cardiolipin synthase A/B
MTINPKRKVRRERRRAARWLKKQARLNRRRPPRKSRLGEAGTARGDCIDAGCVEGGWTLPPPVSLVDGTMIQLYKDGQGLTAAFQGIKSAQKQICLETYIFHSDDTGRAFAAALAEKARSGVRVFVIYDSFGCLGSDPLMFQQMREAGVYLGEFHPLRYWDCAHSWRPLNRDHRKLIVIDNTIAWLGGLNIGAEYGSGFLTPRPLRFELWRDNSVGISGSQAAHFAECFARNWKYIHKDGAIRSAEMVHNIELPKDRHEAEQTPSPPVWSDLGILASVPAARSPLLPFLHSLVRRSHRSLDLTIAYFAPSNTLVDELIRAARRGVRVRMMLPGPTDMRLVRWATRSFYERLLVAGIEVWERQDAVLHAKTMVIDGQITLIGSTNLDYRSIEFNCELSAVIRNHIFARQMAELFAHDISYAEKISLANWRVRPFRDRIVQWAASQARHLM